MSDIPNYETVAADMAHFAAKCKTLQSENAALKEKADALWCDRAELDCRLEDAKKQLAQAREALERLVQYEREAAHKQWGDMGEAEDTERMRMIRQALKDMSTSAKPPADETGDVDE